MKPYHKIPIADCAEPLVPIPLDLFSVVSPHPYQNLEAPYGERDPFYLRQGVLNSLIVAQTHLQKERPGWQIQIFDAYRPISVQEFMVKYSYEQLLQAERLRDEDLSEAQKQGILDRVYQFWALPSSDPKTPPPHSTGAAIDVTLLDSMGEPVDMGSPIDEISPRSYPDRFANSANFSEKNYHARRELLRAAMHSAGFERHLKEWWHFSLGDQMWAWLTDQKIARYGRVN